MKSIILVVIAMSSTQLGASLAKGLFPVIGAFGTSALRLALATLMLWFVFRPWKSKLTPLQFKRLAVYGACLGLMNVFFYLALERIPLGIAVALEFTGPLSVAVFTSKNKKDYLWALLAGIGIYLLMPTTLSGSSIDLPGLLFALMAGAFWAGYILFGKSAGDKIPGGLAACWGMTFASITVLPFGFVVAGTKIFEPNHLVLGLAVAALSSALPYSLEMIAMQNIPTKTFGILMSIEPALAALAGLLILKEQLSPAQWAAIALVMISSAGSTYFSKHVADVQ